MENLLKTKRLEKRLTLEQVGEIVGVGKSTVRKWENGMIENMGRDKIVALSKALDISPLDILGIDKPQESTTKQILDSVFSKLEEPRQDKVVAYAKSELDDQNKVVEIADYQIEKEYPCFEGIQLSPTPPRSPSKKPKQQPITQIKVASSNSLPFLYCFSVSALSTINSAAVYP